LRILLGPTSYPRCISRGADEIPLARTRHVSKRLTSVENFLLDHMGSVALVLAGLVLYSVCTSITFAPITHLEGSTPASSPPQLHPDAQVASAIPFSKVIPDQIAPFDLPETGATTSDVITERPATVTPEPQDPQVFRERQSKPEWIAGVWGPQPGACSKRNAKTSDLLPMHVTADTARAGETVCAFRNKRRVGKEWIATAVCSAPSLQWTSKVRLAVSGNKLRWSSEQGVENYVRCDRVRVANRAPFSLKPLTTKGRIRTAHDGKITKPGPPS